MIAIGLVCRGTSWVSERKKDRWPIDQQVPVARDRIIYRTIIIVYRDVICVLDRVTFLKISIARALNDNR
jgi:hypothetical protein